MNSKENHSLGIYNVVIEYDKPSSSSETGFIHFAHDIPKAFAIVDFSTEETGLTDKLQTDIRIFGADDRMRRIQHQYGEKDVVLAPNTFHIWPSAVPELRLLIAENPDPEFEAEYCFQFTSPADRGTAFLKPTEVKWANDYAPPILPGKTYQGSIMENVIIMVEVSA